MRSERSAFALAVLVGSLLASRTAAAQGNDFSAPTGGRSALMGGTGVALGRDGAAPFLNPAGIVRIEDQRLAFSVNFYTLGLTHYSNFHDPGTVDTAQFNAPDAGGITTSTFRVLPSTLCLFFTIGDLEKIADPKATPIPSDRVMRRKLAICFAAMESEDDNLQAVHFQGNTAAGPTAQVESFSRQWSRTYLGPTYSTYLGDRIAFGASAYGVLSHDAFDINGSSITSRVGGGAIASSLGTSGSGTSVDVTAILGATFLVSDSVTLGLSLRAPSLHLFGSYDGGYNQSTTGSNADGATVTNGSGDFRAPSPFRVAAGIGYETPHVRVEADAAVNIPVASELSTTSNVTTNTLAGGNLSQTQTTEMYNVSNHVAVNPAVGVEYFIRPSFSILTGASVNLSSLYSLTPQPSVGNLVQSTGNQAAATFGIGSYGPHTELLFGAQLQYGWGQALAVNPYVAPNDWAVVDTQSYTMMFIISGATDLRSIENAVIKVENAVQTGDPNKPPEKKPKNDQP